NPCQPTFQRSAPFVTSELRVRFQENFLRRLFNQTSLTKKSTCNAEHSRAVTPDDFSKGRLVSRLRFSRQVDLLGLFEPIRQLRSSSVNTPWSARTCQRFAVLCVSVIAPLGSPIKTTETQIFQTRHTPKKRGETLTDYCVGAFHCVVL